ncbi:MAG TPA: hypothetical protein VNT51_05085, partial [Miltoncostaeaceae bacterium]|nr:hypothetical protein [Miltoncostaeaceae bacterium]
MIRRAAAVALLAAAAPAAPASAGAGAALDHLAAVQGREAREEGAPAPRARALAAWAALAAAAAGEDPAAWPGSGGGLLAAVGPPPRTADPIRPARWALARSAAGRLSGGDARRVRAVLARRASAPPDPLRAAWTLLGLRACGAPADDPAAVALRAHLAATQDPGGGWASGGGTRADTAATGAAVQA